MLSFILLLLNFSFSNLQAGENTALIAKIREEMIRTHHPINYQMANDILFTKLDNHNQIICSVYSPKNCIETNAVPSPKLMNVEHTWPQSEGANGDAKSDLHHIFITDSPTNSIRSSLPFCDVVTEKWTNGFSKRGMSKFNDHCFEPPASHKGDVARALFYFAVRYDKKMDEHQEYFLKIWNKMDPVSNEEILRNNEIQKFQGNTNPFIVDSTLIDLIF
jgi:deoxyribonuclease-1